MRSVVAAHWRVGFACALVTALLWGVLPIGLKVALVDLDAWTLTWYRFAGAALVLGLWLAARSQLPVAALRCGATWRWLAPTAGALIGNYMLYVAGLDLTSPTVAQTVIQLAPLLLLLCGVLVFRERLSGLQWIGFAALVAGMLMFFNRRLPELLYPVRGWGLGVALLIAGAIVWALYGVGQKHLLERLSSQQILWSIYVIATAVLLPMAQPEAVAVLDVKAWVALGFCIANTVIAYGAFVVALDRWEVSRVSSVVSMAPLITLASMTAAMKAGWSWVAPETLNLLSVAGALLVVAGSTVSALGSQRRAAPALGTAARMAAAPNEAVVTAEET
jgi:drug/metabolite transporter (DMT)-like permease